MRVVIDRFEGEFAVCETEERKMINIRRSRLPENAAEGDVLKVDGDSVEPDAAETAKRKQEMEDLTKDMWK